MNKGPLDGIVVLDLTRYISGPYCTMILGNLGARVIKIEHPGVGDEMRTQAPFIDGESAICAGLNHSKESIALDLKVPEDREIFEKLLKKADIFVENFRPGVMERLGYPWKKLHEINPELIGACISGFGQTGPEAQRACYDLVAQGMSGLMSVTGHVGGPPVKAGIDIADISSGVFAAVGILASLFDRTRTQNGLRVGVSLLDSLAAMMIVAIGKYSAEGEIPQATGSRHTLVAPFDVFSKIGRAHV
jgi:CoA:oxalate CoA-transferase